VLGERAAGRQGANGFVEGVCGCWTASRRACVRACARACAHACVRVCSATHAHLCCVRTDAMTMGLLKICTACGVCVCVCVCVRAR
jgi:hypothetical protein